MRAIFSFILCLLLITMVSCSTATQATRTDVQQSQVTKKAKPYFAFHRFSEGVAATWQGEETGFMDESGKFVIKLMFHDARAFSEGLAAVQLNKKWGFINHKGNYIINPQFSRVGDFSEGLAPVEQERRWSYIDKQGKPVIDSLFDEAWAFSEGLAPVKIDGKWGFIAKNGKIQIKPVYKEVKPFREGLSPVDTGAASSPWGFINEHGKMVIKPQFDEAGMFGQGLAPVLIDGSWGYINKSGKFVINPQYGKALTFSDNLAAVRTGQKWGYINTEGKVIVAPQYTAASSYAGGYAAVNANGSNWVYLDRKGKKLGDIAGNYVGDFHPPDVRMTFNNPSVPFSIYNMTSTTLSVKADNTSPYFNVVDGVIIPPFMTYKNDGWPSNGVKAYAGALNFWIADNDVSRGFRIWFFNYETTSLTKMAGLTLVSGPGFGQQKLDYFFTPPADSKGNNCKQDGVMYQRGVRLIGNNFKVFVSAALDECAPSLSHWQPPFAVIVMPVGTSMPKPYSNP